MEIADSSNRHYEVAPPQRLLDAAFEESPEAQLVIDTDGVVAAVNGAARSLLGLPHTVVGRPFQDLEVSYRPVDLRTAIDRAHDRGGRRRPARCRVAHRVRRRDHESASLSARSPSTTSRPAAR